MANRLQAQPQAQRYRYNVDPRWTSAGRFGGSLLGSLLSKEWGRYAPLGPIFGGYGTGALTAYLQDPRMGAKGALGGGLGGLGAGLGGYLGSLTDQKWGAPLGGFVGGMGGNVAQNLLQGTGFIGPQALAGGLVGLGTGLLGQYLEPGMQQALNIVSPALTPLLTEALAPILQPVTTGISQALGLGGMGLAPLTSMIPIIGMVTAIGTQIYNQAVSDRKERHADREYNRQMYAALEKAAPQLKQASTGLMDYGKQRLTALQQRGLDPKNLGLNKLGYTEDEMSLLLGPQAGGPGLMPILYGTEAGKKMFEKGGGWATPATVAWGSHHTRPAPGKLNVFDVGLFSTLSGGAMSGFKGAPRRLDMSQMGKYLEASTAKMLGMPYNPKYLRYDYGMLAHLRRQAQEGQERQEQAAARAATGEGRE